MKVLSTKASLYLSMGTYKFLINGDQGGEGPVLGRCGIHLVLRPRRERRLANHEHRGSVNSKCMYVGIVRNCTSAGRISTANGMMSGKMRDCPRFSI